MSSACALQPASTTSKPSELRLRLEVARLVRVGVGEEESRAHGFEG